MNIGDLVTQFSMFFILLIMIFGIYYTMRTIFLKINSRNTDSKNIEQKLDKIIDLLEKKKKD